MVKYFCDRCGKEFDDVTVAFPTICDECNSKFDRIKIRLEKWEDFLNMTDDDIALMEYDFKINDEVITSDGRVGIIDSICECEKCKKRGFYEPQVKQQKIFMYIANS